MKNSTSITKNTADTNKYKYFLAGIVGFILIWKIISLNYKPIILPSPELTFLNIYQKIKTISFWLNISYSFFRNKEQRTHPFFKWVMNLLGLDYVIPFVTSTNLYYN